MEWNPISGAVFKLRFSSDTMSGRPLCCRFKDVNDAKWKVGYHETLGSVAVCHTSMGHLTECLDRFLDTVDKPGA